MKGQKVNYENFICENFENWVTYWISPYVSVYTLPFIANVIVKRVDEWTVSIRQRIGHDKTLD